LLGAAVVDTTLVVAVVLVDTGVMFLVSHPVVALVLSRFLRLQVVALLR